MELKFGTTRIVLLAGKFAFKFPNFREWRLFLYGLLGNMQEKTFSVYPEVCPVKFYIPGGFLNIAARAMEFTEEDYYKYIHEEYKIDGNSDVVFVNEDYTLRVEDKASSFGWLNGKIAIIDFGDK